MPSKPYSVETVTGAHVSDHRTLKEAKRAAARLANKQRTNFDVYKGNYMLGTMSPSRRYSRV